MRTMRRFDVVIVGASIAGCAAARLFALAGASVVLVERRPDAAAYKVVCTHNILSGALPTIERLGLGELLDRRGAVRTHPEFWTSSGGWVRPPADVPHGYGVTRSTLDPMLRELAAGTPGVELLAGHAAVRLRGNRDRVSGVEVASPDGDAVIIEAPLVVGADGRHSTVARLAGMRGRVRPNNRFFYFTYWRGLRPRTNRARVWFLDPEVAAAFPDEDDLTVVVAGFHRSRLPAVRADPESAYRRAVSCLPDGPDLTAAERASKLIGALDVPTVMRPPARAGLALVGDAAFAADPLFGVGCGWAFQSAEWLVDHTADALARNRRLDGALARYSHTFRRRLRLHYWQIAEFSSGRKLRANERIAFRAAATDASVARALEEMASRRRSPLRLLDPRLAPAMLSAMASARRG
jgi:2-polyprenyl-6-methoxyphenol hydroxylase-like FAD-dependent oxidoreductase